MNSGKRNKPRIKSIIATKIVIVLSILWEMFVISNSFRVYEISDRYELTEKYYIVIKYIISASSPVVVVIGLMWIFGVFRLKP